MNNNITVTTPLLPDLDEFNEMLKEIWKSKWVTNMGQFHAQLEKALCEYLNVPDSFTGSSNNRRGYHYTL